MMLCHSVRVACSVCRTVQHALMHGTLGSTNTAKGIFKNSSLAVAMSCLPLLVTLPSHICSTTPVSHCASCMVLTCFCSC